MKKIAFPLFVLLLPLLIAAQKSPADKIFNKYYGREGYTTLLVSQESFKVISKMEKAEGELKGVMSNIERIRIIAQDNEFDRDPDINFLEELKGLEFNEYREMLVVKESGQEVLMLAREKGGKVAELLILVGGEENALVSIEGLFTMKDLEGLSRLEGLDALNVALD